MQEMLQKPHQGEAMASVHTVVNLCSLTLLPFGIGLHILAFTQSIVTLKKPACIMCEYHTIQTGVVSDSWDTYWVDN